jgi:hypothetical protein
MPTVGIKIRWSSVALSIDANRHHTWRPLSGEAFGFFAVICPASDAVGYGRLALMGSADLGPIIFPGNDRPESVMYLSIRRLD